MQFTCATGVRTRALALLALWQALVMADHVHAKVLRLGKPVDGTSHLKNAKIIIRTGDADVLMLSPDTSVLHVGGSVAVLKDAFNKDGVEYEEVRRTRGAAGGGAGGAELAAMRQQMQAGMDAQAALAAERQEKNESNFSRVIQQANSEHAANAAKLPALQRNLQAAHRALSMQCAEANLQAEITSRRSELQSKAMMTRMEEMAVDASRTTNVLMQIITHVPALAKAITGTHGSGGAQSPGELQAGK